MERFTIRRAAPRDVAAIARHRAEMFRDMGDLGDERYDDLVRASTAYLERAIPAGEYVGWLAALADRPDAIAAGAGVQMRLLIPRPRPGGGAIIAGRQGLIMNVFTERSYRRRGLARSLVQHIIEWASTNDVNSLVLHASAEGRQLYEQLGFVVTNEMRYAGQQR